MADANPDANATTLPESGPLAEDFSLAGDFPPVSREQWRAIVEKDLKGAPFEKKLVSHTYEGLSIQPVYTHEDWPNENNLSGFAGFAPLTRGAHALGSTQYGWDIRQEHAHPDVETSNHAILTDLQRGCTSVQVRFDAAGRHGYDPEQPDALALVGRDGVAAYTVSDLDTLFKGVFIDIAGFGFEAGAAFLPAAAEVVALTRKRGLDSKKLVIAFNADPLAVFARDGRLPYEVEDGLKMMADLAMWTSEHLPASRSIRVGTAPYHNAGATAAQDLGFSMATALDYLRQLTDAGMDLRAATDQLLFSYGLGCNTFLALAKLRAARKLYARIIEACGGDETGMRMKMHVKTSRRVITSRDPWVNLLRNTVTCFAGAVGGADIITTYPLDAAIGLPSDFTRRIARNTQLILNEESHLNQVIDPAGGGWMVEKLTDELAEKGWAVLQDVEKQGGMTHAVKSEWVRKHIDAAYAPRFKNLARRKDAVTGVSEFPSLSEKPVEAVIPDYDAVRQAAQARVESDRGADDAVGLSEVVHASGVARVEVAIKAAEAGASIGQLATALGFHKVEPRNAPITPHPYAEAFEQLRDASDDYERLTGARPRVGLVCLGHVAEHTVRATYARNFFEAGGFEVRATDPVETTSEALEAFRDTEAGIAVICSSDKRYEAQAGEISAALKQGPARTVILAGFPGDHEATFREAGVDRFIYMRCDVLQTLRELLQEEGVLS